MLDGSYFCFVSLSTIGFGDFVPGDKIYSGQGLELSFIFCSMYLMLGKFYMNTTTHVHYRRRRVISQFRSFLEGNSLRFLIKKKKKERGEMFCVRCYVADQKCTERSYPVWSSRIRTESQKRDSYFFPSPLRAIRLCRAEISARAERRGAKTIVLKGINPSQKKSCNAIVRARYDRIKFVSINA